MEKEGLHRCLSFLKEHDLNVEVLVLTGISRSTSGCEKNTRM